MKSALYLTKVLAKILAKKSPPELLHDLQLILTEKEMEFLENRLRIAYRLRQGGSYAQIQNELKVSAATVAVVAEQMRENEFSRLVDQVEKEMTRFAWLRKRLSF